MAISLIVKPAWKQKFNGQLFPELCLLLVILFPAAKISPYYASVFEIHKKICYSGSTRFFKSWRNR